MCHCDRNLKAEDFERLYHDFGEMLARTVNKGVVRAWFELHRQYKDKHLIMLNTYGVDSLRVLELTLENWNADVKAFLVNYDLWNANDKRQFKDQYGTVRKTEEGQENKPGTSAQNADGADKGGSAGAADKGATDGSGAGKDGDGKPEEEQDFVEAMSTSLVHDVVSRNAYDLTLPEDEARTAAKQALALGVAAAAAGADEGITARINELQAELLRLQAQLADKKANGSSQ